MSRKSLQIFCINCIKMRGHYEEDIIKNGVKKPLRCKRCGNIVVDIPNIDKNNINLNKLK